MSGRRRPWRITTAQGKVGYVVGATVIGWLVLLVPLGLHAPDQVTGIVLDAYFLAWIVVGVRVFRGPGEQVETPRAWWRMTARPWAGFVLAAFFALSIASPGGMPSDPGRTAVQLLVAAAFLVASVVLAVRNGRTGRGDGAGTIEDVPHDHGAAPE